MKIRLESVEFDGVGPFADRQRIDLGENNKVVVYAPNGHGKTTTIDLMRWLLQGDSARDSFKSLKPDYILNRERWTGLRQGSVMAVVAIEGRGRFQIRRTEVLGKITSELSIGHWDDAKGKFVAVSNPSSVLLRFFPPERVGFNLLTGEHVQAFQQQIRGEDVRESIEKLLQFPEIASAQDVLAEIAGDLQAKAAQQARGQKRNAKLADEVDAMQTEMRQLRDSETAAGALVIGLNAEIEELVEQIGQLKGGSGDKARYDELSTAVQQHEDQIQRVREDARDALAQSWRRIAIKAALPRVRDHVKCLEEFNTEHRAWEGRLGLIEKYEQLKSDGTCVCLRPVDDNARQILDQEIARIQSDEPSSPPSFGIDDWTIRAWAEDDRFHNLVERLERLHGTMQDLGRDKRKFEDSMASIEAALDHGVMAEIERLERKRNGLADDRRQASEAKADATRRIVKLRGELENAERKLGSSAGAVNLGDVASVANAYAEAFRAVIDAALPWYRAKLQERVQAIFRKLYQKDPDAEVEFEDRSCVPRIRLPSAGNKVATHGSLSDGEQMRLGLALLIGLREVASERPFLMLDAPFSELDDEGILRLLETIGDIDSQVIIFTKNRFKPDEYGRVAAMRPAVVKMDWASKAGAATKGHTLIEPGTLEMLDAEVVIA